MNGPRACCRVPWGCSVAVTPMCQGGAGVTGGARAAATTGLLVGAMQQQQCGVLQQNDEGIMCRDSRRMGCFCELKSNVFFNGLISRLC